MRGREGEGGKEDEAAVGIGNGSDGGGRGFCLVQRTTRIPTDARERYSTVL